MEKSRIIAGIAIVMLVFAVVIAICLAILAYNRNFVDDPTKDQPSLRVIWVYALWSMKQGPALKVTFGAVIALLSAGVIEASNLMRSGWALLLLVLLCGAGIIGCGSLLVSLDTPETLATLRWFGEFQSDAQVQSAANWLFGALIGWFGLFAAALLGVRFGMLPNPLRRVGTGG